jgi:LDH2 family malate/lactate/ureidoglycolate dehydrogenase
MNEPPTDGIRVKPDDLASLTEAIFRGVGTPDDHASLIARLLVDTELRGVVSHGVMQVERYVRDMKSGSMNPRPEPKILREGPSTASWSGDGGLGMIVATRAMEMAIEKAKSAGLAAVTTTYHDHVGSVGKYIRMALREGLIGIGSSGRNASPTYDHSATPLSSIQGSPPLAFGMPSGEGRADFLLDMATHLEIDASWFEKMPAVFFKAIGISHAANILSGTLGGQMLPEFDRRNIKFSGANQSGFFLVIDIERFTDLGAFKADMDHLVSEVEAMQPFPGQTKAYLPGGLEFEREREYRRDGAPISAATKKSLEELAGEFGVKTPW